VTPADPASPIRLSGFINAFLLDTLGAAAVPDHSLERNGRAAPNAAGP
jgi:hypothetical protein